MALQTAENKELEFDLAFEIHYLLHREPFYAAVSRNMAKVPDYNIPTAGVRFSEETLNFELRYNPKMMAQLKREHGKFVLCHEFDHCIFGHITERLPVDPNLFVPGAKISKKDRDKLNKWNIATDFAINSLENMKKLATGIEWIDPMPTRDGRHLKRGIIMPGPDAEDFSPLDPQMTKEEKAERQKFLDMAKQLPEGESAEWYMKNMPKGMGESGEGHGDHSGWAMQGDGKGDKAIQDAIKRIAKQKMKDMVKKAFDDANQAEIEGSDGWGSVSHQMRQRIADLIKPKLDPQKALRYFVKTSVVASERNSITKINKKWAYIHPGRRYDEVANIAISIDESGSVGNEMMKKFFGWLNALAKFATFTVIPFDDEVFEDKVYVWEQGTHKPVHRELRGGTNFDAPTDFVNKRNFDGHIILTDMCAGKPGRSKCQRMWITTQACAQRSYFETNERILVVD